jgi:hypothetical protein
MLVSRGYQEGDIVSFKLITGDEVVARIIDSGPNGFEISKPCTVMPGPQGMVLQKDHVLIHAPSIDAIQKHYIKTTTGIEPVTRGSIIT